MPSVYSIPQCMVVYCYSKTHDYHLEIMVEADVYSVNVLTSKYQLYAKCLYYVCRNWCSLLV